MGRPGIIRTGQRGGLRILQQQWHTIVQDSVPQTVKVAMDSTNWVEWRKTMDTEMYLDTG